jgi:hypothetical protein
MIRVGVTGHQARPGIDWGWVDAAIGSELDRRAVERGFSSLAVGSDQVFADACLNRGVPVTAVLPLKQYDAYFAGEGLEKYNNLIARCEVVQLNSLEKPEVAFFAAGCYVVENCDLLIAVWDGAPSKGVGGTGDVVAHAKQVKREIVILNPVSRTYPT